MAAKNYLDLAGLQAYDGLIKAWVNGTSAAGKENSGVIFRTILHDNDNIYFYHKANAQRETEPFDIADVTVPLTGSDVTKALAEISAIVTALGGTMAETAPYTVTFPALTTDAKASLVAAINEVDAHADSANNAAAAAQGAADAAQADVDALETLVGTLPQGATATTVVGYANEAATNAANSAVNALDTLSDITVASNTDGVVTLTAGIKEENGIIAKGTGADITLAKVATTGSSADVTYDNTTSGLTATDVKAAIDEVAAASAGGVESKTVYLQDESAGQSDYAKVYKLYQGANAPSAQTDPAALIGTINIPKDLVVQSGSVVQVFYNGDDHLLHEGSVAGPDVTNYIVPEGGTPSAQYEGKYIKLIIQNQTAPLFIAVKDLVDVYTGGTTTEATVAISATNEITVTINSIAASKITHGATTVEAALNTIEGNDTTAGSIAKAQKDAQDYADGAVSAAVVGLTGTAGVASVTGDVITIKGGVTQANGRIGNDTSDDVTISPISTTNINNLFNA